MERTFSTAAVVENLIKHQWSRTILRHLRNGTTNPVDISGIEMCIAPSAMSERLRTMVRYNLIRRSDDSSRPRAVHYRLTAKGRRVLSLLEVISRLDDVPDHDPRALEEVFDAQFRMRPPAPLIIADAPPAVVRVSADRILRSPQSA